MGHEEGGQLTERVKRNPYCVVLLDEIEKAHPDVFNVLLQVFEDGHLTDGLGNTVDFKNAILIMTSNIGARFIEKKGRMGFASNEPRETVQATNEMVMGEVKRTFNPEFINRIDEIIIFDALTDQDLVKITRLLVEQLNQNLQGEGRSRSRSRDEAVEWLLGAHPVRTAPTARGPLRRAIQRHIEDALSEAFIRGQIRAGPPDRGGGEGRGALVPAGRARRSAVRMKRTRAAVLGAWLLPGGARPRRRGAQAGRDGRRRRSSSGSRSSTTSSSRRRPCSSTSRRSRATATTSGKLREDFKRLWDTGFLDDLQIEVVDGPGGKVVRFKVTERKRIQIVDYRGSKDLTTSNIEDELKKADAQIKIDTFYDPAKARKVEEIIKEMLAAEGPALRHGQARGEEHRRLRPAALVHRSTTGRRRRSTRSSSTATTSSPDKTLAGKMKKIKAPGFTNLSWLGGKTTYTEEKWLGGEEDPRGDRGRLEDFYLDHGYVTARIGQPKITLHRRQARRSKKKPEKLMRLEIPVTEGEQYRIGEVKFEGLTVLKEDVRPRRSSR